MSDVPLYGLAPFYERGAPVIAFTYTTHYPLYTSLCTGELNAIRKHETFFCSPFYVKGVSLGHVGRNSNLKDLIKDSKRSFERTGTSAG